jgi:hypothetical protein
MIIYYICMFIFIYYIYILYLYIILIYYIICYIFIQWNAKVVPKIWKLSYLI